VPITRLEGNCVCFGTFALINGLVLWGCGEEGDNPGWNGLARRSDVDDPLYHQPCGDARNYESVWLSISYRM